MFVAHCGCCVETLQTGSFYYCDCCININEAMGQERLHFKWNKWIINVTDEWSELKEIFMDEWGT